MVCILNGCISTHVTYLILPLGLETSLALSESVTPGSERATGRGWHSESQTCPFSDRPCCPRSSRRIPPLSPCEGDSNTFHSFTRSMAVYQGPQAEPATGLSSRALHHLIPRAACGEPCHTRALGSLLKDSGVSTETGLTRNLFWWLRGYDLQGKPPATLPTHPEKLRDFKSHHRTLARHIRFLPRALES